MLWFKKINSIINIDNINNNKMRKSNFLEFQMFPYLSVSHKQWNVRLNLWQKSRVTENEICKLKI